MKFISEVWQKQAEKYVESFRKVVPFHMRFEKNHKSEQVIPRSLVDEMIRDAYKQGAETALKMAEEIG